VDFSDPSIQAIVTPQQQTDLSTWLCTPVPPTFDYSFAFLGVNSYIVGQTGGVYNIERNQPFSFSSWFTRPNATRQTLMSKKEAQTGYSIDVLADGRVYVFMVGGAYGAGRSLEVATIATIPLTTFGNVLVTYSGNGLASGIKIYINGISVAFNIFQNTFNTFSMLNTAPIQLGATTALGLFANYSVNTGRMWNTQLSPTDAATESLGTLGKPNATPVQQGSIIMDTDFDMSVWGVDVFTIPDSSNINGFKTINAPFSSRFVQP